MKKTIRLTALLLALCLLLSGCNAFGEEETAAPEQTEETQAVQIEETEAQETEAQETEAVQPEETEQAEEEDPAGSLLSDLFSNPEQDYGDYVQSLLDVEYKGITDTYMELTGDTQENSDAFYPACMRYWAYILADYFLIVPDISTEVEERLVSLTEDVFSHVNYEVADAVQSDDYYTVEVTISPMLFVTAAYDEVVAYAEDFQARSDAGEHGDYQNDEEAYTAREIEYANGVMDILEKYTADIQYDEPVSKIVKIEEDADGYYGISDEDYADLENYLLY